MVKSLLALLQLLYRSAVVELVGAGLVVAALYLAWGLPAALAGAGVALLLKSLELDLAKPDR